VTHSIDDSHFKESPGTQIKREEEREVERERERKRVRGTDSVDDGHVKERLRHLLQSLLSVLCNLHLLGV
jgi:hypothetical protein